MSWTRSVAVLVVTTSALAACGASHRTARSPSAGLPRTDGAVATAGSPDAPPVAAGASPYPTAPYAPAAQPTTCTVFGPGYATQVIFDSSHLDVKEACQSWSARTPGTAYLWSYGPASTPSATQLCRLTDRGGNLTATVIEDAPYVPLSHSERASGASACQSILASGWIARPGRPQTRPAAASRRS